MEVHERIKELRKNHLKMSQTAFGEKLGVSRSVINNIELNVLARPEQKLSLMKLICKEFNVNEEWLLNGTGDMFGNKEAEYNTLIDQIMVGENELAKNIFKTFTAFDKADWEALGKMIEKYNSIAKRNTEPTAYDNVSDTPEECTNKSEQVNKLTSVEFAEEEYIKKISDFARHKNSTALSSTEEDTENHSDKKKIGND
ncbi:MAG: helix-turn-helix domain-containing protein [Coprococcus sp.]